MAPAFARFLPPPRDDPARRSLLQPARVGRLHAELRLGHLDPFEEGRDVVREPVEWAEQNADSFNPPRWTVEWDFAFIEVDPEDVGRVSPAVKGHPAFPTGATTPAETSRGDSIQLSGYGLGYGTTRPTQEQRTAVMGFDDASNYDVTGPIHWGDSGGPLVHIRTGKALGIVSRLCVGGCTEMGPTVQGILSKAASKGFTVTLKTV